MRVGIIGDTHFPFVHPEYLTFCRDTFKAWKVDAVVHIGDVVDAHAISFHEHDPNGMSAEDEAAAARECVQEWAAVPEWRRKLKKVCIGNHDERICRVARKGGLPDRYLKSYAEVWGTPNWEWDFYHTIDGVLYEHGTGTSGKDAALNRAIQKRRSLVMGHTHCYAGVKFHANEFDIIFGLNVGCAVDCRAYAFAYGRAFPVRPVLGCGIVIDGRCGIFEPMLCGEGDPYQRHSL